MLSGGIGNTEDVASIELLVSRPGLNASGPTISIADGINSFHRRRSLHYVTYNSSGTKLYTELFHEVEPNLRRLHFIRYKARYRVPLQRRKPLPDQHI